MRKELTIEYEVFENDTELSDIDRDLLNMARESMNYAYAPYSNFKVGSAVLLNNGEIQTGNNQENSSFSATICAERTALHAAVHLSDCPVRTIAIVGSSGITMGPCGVCRQVMSEYELRYKQKMRIILQDGLDKIMIFDGVENLLPFQFHL